MYNYENVLPKSKALGGFRKWFDSAAEVLSHPMPEGGYQVEQSPPKSGKGKRKKTHTKEKVHK